MGSCRFLPKQRSLTPSGVCSAALPSSSDAFGSRLRSVWLYGSRARGDERHPESDIDVLVVVDPLLPDDDLEAVHLSWRAVDEKGPVDGLISTLVYSSEHLTQRREIRSFFIQEVDRDKIVLFGEA